MLICIAGDLHGEIAAFYKYLEIWQTRTGNKIDGVLQVGDFGIFSDLKIHSDYPLYLNKTLNIPIPTWVIAGNHESWSDVQQWMRYPDQICNLELLPDGEITEVLGKKIGVVWGNFSPRSWADPKVIDHVRKYDPNSLKAMHVYKPSVNRLLTLGKFDILLTHDAPKLAMRGKEQPPVSIKRQLGLGDKEKCYGVSQFHDLWVSGQPTHHFWGHMHSYRVIERTAPVLIQLGCFNYNRESSIYFMEI